MIGVLDYGAGNLGNLCRALSHLGIPFRVLARPERGGYGALVIPGVGAFGPARERLLRSGLWEMIRAERERGTPILGICLGMQLLCLKSSEMGEHEGLGLVGARVERFSKPRKVPHMGWNEVIWSERWAKVAGCERAFYYFVHSYRAEVGPWTCGLCEHDGEPFSAAVEGEGVVGFQFHPERSGAWGLRLLEGLMRGWGVIQ